jgi:apolipoprotein N-acyltransferase
MLAAFPPFNLWPLIWIALVPLYLALSDASKKSGAWPGFLFGLTLNGVGMHWMSALAPPLWIALALLQAGFFAIFGALTSLLLPKLPSLTRPFVFAAAWVLFEWTRSLGVYAFPWFLLASSHARESALPILQIASLTAQWGLSFAICIATGFLGEAWQSKNKRYLSALLVPACLWVLGRYAMTQTAKPGVSLSVAVIQANDKGANNSFALYEGLTRRAVAEQKPQLIVWPEGSVRGDALGQASVGALARELNTAILIGCYDEETQSKRPRNRALLFDARGIVSGTYQKQRLAPFG